MGHRWCGRQQQATDEQTNEQTNRQKDGRHHCVKSPPCGGDLTKSEVNVFVLLPL